MVSLLLIVVFLELFLRLAHLGRAPLLPYVEGDGGVPSLPAGMDQTVSFWWGKPTRYVVDEWGARIARPELARYREGGGVLVVGDSQALGYQIAFEQTFAAEIALTINGRSDSARILASPAIDPEQELFAVKRYVIGLPRQKLAVLVLNMSNDLDEMFTGAESVRGAPQSALQNALMSHSFLYMDWANLWQQYLTESYAPPGMNPILYAMSSDERVVLADQTVRLLREMAAQIPAERRIVVIVPNKYQVNVKLFEDFRRYYRSRQEFNRWYDQTANAADQMNALETYIASELNAANIPVIRFAILAKAGGDVPGTLFQKKSEHISERGHRLIADAILGSKV
jgi:hypothetical protein